MQLSIGSAPASGDANRRPRRLEENSPLGLTRQAGGGNVNAPNQINPKIFVY